jgi:hypothetical protein
MKKIIVGIAIAVAFNVANAQIKDTTYWSRSLQAGININQAAFSDTWKTGQGGLNNIALSAFVFGKSEYVKNRSKVVNDLQLQYGRVLAEGVQDYKGENTWRKNVDRIFFDNVYTYALTNTLGAFASVNFQSQFDKGFKFEKTKGGGALLGGPTAGLDSAVQVSNFLAPGTLIEGVGVEWTPAKFFSLRVAPVAFRQSFSVDQTVTTNVTKADGTHLGVSSGAKIKNDFGLNVLAKFDKDLVENINLKIIGQYFSAYDNIAIGTVRVDAILTAKVTKYINVNLTGVLVYNQAQIARIQANQQLALGVVYKIGNAGK